LGNREQGTGNREQGTEEFSAAAGPELDLTFERLCEGYGAVESFGPPYGNELRPRREKGDEIPG